MSSPVAIVTGASRGIGKKLSVDLAAAGYDVACAARSTAEQPSKLPGSIDETADLVRKLGRRAITIPLDVRDEEACQAAAEQVLRELGRCDLLINNAAIAPPKPALQDSTKRWRLAVDVNVNGPFYLMYYLCPHMQGGRVINISSGASVTPEFGRASYTATKAALEGLSQALGHDLRGKVAVNALRLDLPVWSEGFADTLSPGHGIPFEDPVIMSDAVLWMIRQPLDFTARVLTITGLREQGVVRPMTPWKEDG